MMPIFLLITFSVNALYAAPTLSRQWSRSTLVQENLKFRHLNRMSPILTEDLVIQGNSVDGIKAFKRKSGHKVWSLFIKNGVEGGADLSENKLYFGGNDGVFYCVNLSDGKIVWSQELHSESLAKPLVVGNQVYHVTGNNTLYAFDKNSGRSLWIKTNAAKSNMTVRGQTSPVYENGFLYLGFSDGSFSSFNATNGREIWTKRIGDDKKFNDVDATAVLTSACILVSSYANSLFCLDKSSGQIKWRHDFGGYNSITVDENIIYYPTGNNEIHLLDLESGKLLRKIVNIKGLATEISVIDDHIVYGESLGALIIRNKKTLEKVNEFRPGTGIFAKPSIDKDKKLIYFISNQSNIYSLKIKDSPENHFLWSRTN